MTSLGTRRPCVAKYVVESKWDGLEILKHDIPGVLNMITDLIVSHNGPMIRDASIHMRGEALFLSFMKYSEKKSLDEMKDIYKKFLDVVVVVCIIVMVYLTKGVNVIKTDDSTPTWLYNYIPITSIYGLFVDTIQKLEKYSCEEKEKIFELQDKFEDIHLKKDRDVFSTYCSSVNNIVEAIEHGLEQEIKTSLVNKFLQLGYLIHQICFNTLKETNTNTDILKSNGVKRVGRLDDLSNKLASYIKMKHNERVRVTCDMLFKELEKWISALNN